MWTKTERKIGHKWPEDNMKVVTKWLTFLTTIHHLQHHELHLETYIYITYFTGPNALYMLRSEIIFHQPCVDSIYRQGQQHNVFLLTPRPNGVVIEEEAGQKNGLLIATWDFSPIMHLLSVWCDAASEWMSPHWKNMRGPFYSIQAGPSLVLLCTCRLFNPYAFFRSYTVGQKSI